MGTCEEAKSIPLREIRSPLLYWQASDSDRLLGDRNGVLQKVEYDSYLNHTVGPMVKIREDFWERFSDQNNRYSGVGYWIGRTVTDLLIDGAVAGFTAIAKMSSQLI